MRKLKIFCSVILLGITLHSPRAFTASVFARDGNIFFVTEKGHEDQLTNRGFDRSPVLSPSGEQVGLIRKSSQTADYPAENPDGYTEYELLVDQIWVVDIPARKERLVVEEMASEDPSKNITHIRDGTLRYSSDGSRIYFISESWVSSGAVYVVNTDGSDLRFVTAGNSIDVVTGDEYKDHLIVKQHRYLIGGGSYDWLWLFNPNGKEVGPIGDELTDNQLEFLGLKKK